MAERNGLIGMLNGSIPNDNRLPQSLAARCRATLAQVGNDGIDCGRNAFMLPEPHNNPSGALERVGLLAVARGVPRQLRRPVLTIDTRLPTVFGAAMPEAAVDEDGDALSGECNVWAG